jgi:hypothetical protein
VFLFIFQMHYGVFNLQTPLLRLNFTREFIIMNFKALLGAAFGAFLFSGQAFATTAAPAHYPSPLTCTRNFYVDPIGTDNATCGAGPAGATSNCKTPWGADAATSIGATGTVLTGGDCVHVTGSAPTETATGSSGWTSYPNAGTATFNRSGTANQANGYINYVCSVNHGCYINRTAVASSSLVRLAGNYIALDGFEFDGHNIQGYTGYKASNTNTYNVGGEQIFSNNAGHHHFWLNNISHGSGGGVLGDNSNDYQYFIANEGYDGSGTNGSHTSLTGLYLGRSITPNGAQPWDTNVYKIQWIANVIHDGGETAVINNSTNNHTDGEALILDDWQNDQSCPGTFCNVQYTGKALVAYNYFYNMGGKGLLQYTAGNAVFENNTLLNNCLDPSVVTNRGCKEFESAGLAGWNGNGTSSIMQNNLAIRLGTGSQAAYNVAGANATGITNNESFDTVSGGASFSGGLAVAGANPLLGINPNVVSTNSPFDLHPQGGSPALGSGVANITTQFTLMTPDGQVPASPPNMGAFNVTGGGCGPAPLPPCPGLGPVSINAGGPAVTGAPPQASFIADTHFTVNHGAATNNNPTGAVDTSLVVNPAPTAVYRTERWDNPVIYTVDGLTPGKTYSVRLHFTEDWPADEFVGKRIFNIALNGTQVLANFDIFATAGAAHKAVVECFSQVADANGKITVTLTTTVASVDLNAKIDGVEVLLMPTASISANPTNINVGQSSTLTWSSMNSTRCIGTGFSTNNAVSGSLVVTPSGNTTYSISCDAGGVAATASQTVTVNSTLSASLTASPTTVVSGGSSTLTWTSNATTKCVGTNFSTANATSGTQVVNPTANTTYSIACDSGGTPVNASATVMVSAVTASLSANPATILNGQSSTLTWSSNGSRCVGTGFQTGNAPSGTLSVSPTANTTYSIACDNGGATTPATTTVTVNPVTASLSASPATITSGGSSTLSWSSNGTRCIGNGFSTANAASGTQSVSPTITTTYSVACDAGGAATTAPTTVTVTGTPSASIMSNVTAVPSNVATISWSSMNAAVCTGTNFNTNGATSGSVQVSPLVTTTYSVTCDSSPVASVQVIVPQLSCTAGPPLSCNWVADPPPAIAAAIATPTTIYSQGLAGDETSWQGYNLRVVIPTAALSAGPNNKIRVTVQTASTATSSAILDSLWIGTAASSGNAYNFSGDQVQLKFTGSNSTALGPSLTIASDWAGFAYQGTGSNLVVAAHFSGTTADTPFGGHTNQYYIQAADSGGTTAPTGTWTAEAQLAFITMIETQ